MSEAPSQQELGRRQAILRRTTGMKNRRSEPDCPLCQLWGVAWDDNDADTWGRQHAHVAELWREWDGRFDWAERAAAKSAALGRPATEEQVKRHFTHHQIEQPYQPSAALGSQAALLDAAAELSGRERNVLTAIYRQRMLSRRQIEEVFYSGRPGLKKSSARVKATEELTRLIRGHFAYRWYPDPAWTRKPGQPAELTNEFFYFIGKAALPYLRSIGVKMADNLYVALAAEVGLGSLVHDWLASELYVRLNRALRENGGEVELPDGRRTTAFLLSENWYGSRQLAMRLHDNRARRELEIRPDGFCALSLERSGYDEGALPSCQLPFFYEYDHGSKEAAVVARQMLAYHQLGRSRGAVRRFPDLNIEGYAVPMVIVFDYDKRVDEVQRSFLRQAARERYRTGTPIFLVSERDWMSSPLAPGILRLAWDEDGRSFSLVEALLLSSRRLLEHRTLSAGQVLRLHYESAHSAAVRQAIEERKRSSNSRAKRPLTDSLTTGNRLDGDHYRSEELFDKGSSLPEVTGAPRPVEAVDEPVDGEHADTQLGRLPGPRQLPLLQPPL